MCVCVYFFITLFWSLMGKIGRLGFVIGNFCCWTNCFGLIYFVLDFRCIIFFFIAFKKRKNVRVKNHFTNYWYDEWLLVNKKSNISSEPRCELVINCTSTVCKDIVEKFVVISLLLKESTILFRGQSVILNNKIAKSSTYINSSNLKF